MVLELTQSIAHHLWLTRAEIFSSPGSTLVVQEGFWRRKVFAPRVHGLSGTPHLQDFAVATLALCASDSHQEGASICTVHCCAEDTGCTTAKMGLFGKTNMCVYSSGNCKCFSVLGVHREAQVDGLSVDRRGRGPVLAVSPSQHRVDPSPAFLSASSPCCLSESLSQDKTQTKGTRCSAGSTFLLCITGHLPGLHCQGFGGMYIFQRQSWLQWK